MMTNHVVVVVGRYILRGRINSEPNNKLFPAAASHATASRQIYQNSRHVISRLPTLYTLAVRLATHCTA